MAAFFLAIAYAAPAYADEQSFTDAVAKIGYANHGDALKVGYTVCALESTIGSYMTGKVIHRALAKINDTQDDLQSDEFARLAVTLLCPSA